MAHRECSIKSGNVVSMFNSEYNYMSRQRNIIFDLHGVLFEHTSPNDNDNNHKLFSPIDDGIAVLKACYYAASKKGYKLYACTNWTMRYIDMLEQDFPHIFKMFDGVVTPTVALAKKPDAKMYRYLLDTYDLIPHDSIFIDDQLSNVEAAKSHGMSGIHVRNFSQLQKELASLEIL